MAGEDYEKTFEEAVLEWRTRHRLRDDDAVILLIELFVIHQKHWDRLRRSELPSFEQFRGDIAKLTESARVFQQQAGTLIDRLHRQPVRQMPGVSFRKALLAATLAALAGYLFARIWP